MTKDELYNNIVKLTPYRSDKDIEFRDVLSEALMKYKVIVEEACKSNEKIIGEDIYTEVCKDVNQLKNIAKSCYEGKPSKAYSQLRNLLNKYSDKELFIPFNIPLRVETEETEETMVLYRMRVFEGQRRKIPRKDMYHIPMKERRKVQTQRYSIPGYPCLYMGLSLYACWEEMGRPRMNDCWASRVENQDVVNLLDLRVPTKQSFVDNISKYIRLFPLIISCMIPVKEENHKYVYKPEYIVPQLVMEWLIMNNDCDREGIAYTSAMAGNDFDYPQGKIDNVVIPIKKPLAKTNYCPDLMAKFRITEPVNNEIEKLRQPQNTTMKSLDFGTYGEKEKITDEKDRKERYEASDFNYLEDILKKKNAKDVEKSF